MKKTNYINKSQKIEESAVGHIWLEAFQPKEPTPISRGWVPNMKDVDGTIGANDNLFRGCFFVKIANFCVKNTRQWTALARIFFLNLAILPEKPTRTQIVISP